MECPENQKYKVVRVQLTLNFIKSLCMFPKESKILDCRIVRTQDDYKIESYGRQDAHSIEVILQDDNLPEIEEGTVIPLVNPTYKASYIPDPTNPDNKIKKVDFDWNI